MTFINSVVSWIIKKRIHQIELFVKYPHDVQNEWFKKLINSSKDTEWGKKYNYKSINNPIQFNSKVPVSDYDSIKSYITRMMNGEQNILWSTDVKWFAKSSGTTSDKSKFIPVTFDALEECHFKGGKDMLSIYYHNNPNTKLFDGKGLALGGSHYINEFNNEQYYGDLSAIIIENLPFWVEFIRTPNKQIALMSDWEVKLDKLAMATLSENVTNISGVPSWTLLVVKRILELTGKSNLLEVWPNLELFAHGGVNFEPYMEQFKALIPSSEMNYLNTYNASEGFFGIQDRNNHDDMLLMLDYGIYYEFAEVKDLNSKFPKTYTLDEVKTGVEYALIISTNAGLWRYLIGDTVRFTSLNPYRIKITGRTKNFINVAGEELIIENAEKALTIATQKTKSIINEFTAAPIYIEKQKRYAHQWIIEFEHKPEDINYFTEVLDNSLKSLNSDYEAKRTGNLALTLPQIVVVEKNTFYNWMKQRGKLGGQHKVPRLSNDRKYIDEILELIKLNSYESN